MSPEQENAIAEAAALKAVKIFAEQHKCAGCFCEVDMAMHEKDHEFIKALTETLNKINEVKWGVIKSLAVTLVLGLLALVGFNYKQ